MPGSPVRACSISQPQEVHHSPGEMEDGLARFGVGRGRRSGWLALRDEAEFQALLEKRGVAEILAGGQDAAFHQDGVDVLASGAAERRRCRSRGRRACRSSTQAPGRGDSARLDHLRVGPLRLHVGEDQDADEQRRPRTPGTESGRGRFASFALRGREEGHRESSVPIAPVTIVKWVTSVVAATARRGDLEFAAAPIRRARTRTGIRRDDERAPGRFAKREDDRGGRLAAIRERVAEAVVDAAVGADAVELAAIGRDAGQHGCRIASAAKSPPA